MSEFVLDKIDPAIPAGHPSGVEKKEFLRTLLFEYNNLTPRPEVFWLIVSYSPSSSSLKAKKLDGDDGLAGPSFVIIATIVVVEAVQGM